MKDEYYLIKEAAAKIGVESHVLRYWEEELKMEIRRNEMGHRYYTERDIEIFTRVRDLKEKGLQLKAIRSYLEKRREQLAVSEQTEDIVETVSGEKGKKAGVQKRAEVQEQDTEREAEQEVRKPVAGRQAKQETRKPDTGRQREQKALRSASEEQTDKVHQADSGENIAEHRELQEKKGSGLETEKSGEQLPKNEQEAGGQTGTASANKKLGESSGKTGELVPAGSGVLSNEEKLQQFQQIMNRILSSAIQENHELIGETAGRHAADAVVTTLQGMTKEQEAKVEARYQKLDQTLREIQRARQEAAAANMRPVDRRRQKRLKRKNAQAFYGDSPE